MTKRIALAQALASSVVLALFALAMLVAPAALLTGCETPDFDDLFSSDPATAGAGATAPASDSAGSVAGSSSSSAVTLDYRYGGFKGGSAKEDSRCRISNFKMGKSGCSLKWETEIPGDWKRGEGGFVIAAIFYKDGDRWVGGKFDWIDRSRSTRDFKNIDGGYNGWNASAFRAAKKHAFCVVSADGKLRSNLLED